MQIFLKTIYKKSNENSDITLNQLEDMDEVISICEMSDEVVVRFAKYIEDHNLIMDKCKYYMIYAIRIQLNNGGKKYGYF